MLTRTCSLFVSILIMPSSTAATSGALMECTYVNPPDIIHLLVGWNTWDSLNNIVGLIWSSVSHVFQSIRVSVMFNSPCQVGEHNCTCLHVSTIRWNMWSQIWLHDLHFPSWFCVVGLLLDHSTNVLFSELDTGGIMRQCPYLWHDWFVVEILYGLDSFLCASVR